MTSKISIIVLIFCCLGQLFSQNTKPRGNVIVDRNGLMRWENSKEEVKGFGVNYTVPFAHAYRSAQKLGIYPKKAIDNDVYHFTRLGFDLFRVHVWDTQISDVEGNLLENEYLETFDYLLKKLKEHNINYVITPIAFWGDGWPEPDTETPGFSHKYGKDKALTNLDAIRAQQKYLHQFLNHVNPYTGVAYKDEPNIIAFEVSNEPHHRGKEEDVTNFVKGMVDAMRKTGTKKPIFYNMSHAVQFMDAYFKGGADGGTFQWYPTGLGYQQELSGNLLPNVNDYNMPFESIIKKHRGAKLVYEFDAADVGKSYIYPAMARSFRSAGIQIATHFSYDPTYLAPYNTEYNTHYMNLNYTPQKALSLKICSEVFHEIPMYSNFGVYPENNSFENFSVNYQKDLAEYNSEDKFFYTNDTQSTPKNHSKLKEIAGYGNSAVVNYDGTGAYFLDKIEDGLWRLEVMPDAIRVDNPFGRNSLDKKVAVINWETHEMSVDLKNLGKDFSIEALNEGNLFSTQVDGNSFKIRPGSYMLSWRGIAKNWSRTDAFKTNKLNDFYAPKSNVENTYLNHIPKDEISEETPLIISTDFISELPPKELMVLGNNGPGTYFNIQMQSDGKYHYSAEIPTEYMHVGFLNYNIVATFEDDSQITYPSGKEGNLYDWDFYDRKSYEVAVVAQENPIYLFNAIDDSELLVQVWRQSFKLVPTKNYHQAEYQMNIENLFVLDIENLNANPIYDYSFKHFIIDKIRERKEDLSLKKELIFFGRALNNKSCKLQIALVMDDGSSFGKVIDVGTEIGEYKLNLNDLRPVKTVTLPRPYPSFLPYFLEHDLNSKFDLSRVESIQFSIGPEIPNNELGDSHGIGIVNISLE